MPEKESRKVSVLDWAWIFYLGLAVGGVVWLGLRRGSIDLGFFVDSTGWPVDVAVGLGVASVLSGGWELVRRLLPEARGVEKQFARILGPLTVSEAIALAILSAIAEEFFFRGAVQDAWGYLPAALLFSMLHMGPGRDLRLWTAFAAIAGLALGGLVVWRGTLLAAIVAHALVNAVGLSRMALEARTSTDG